MISIRQIRAARGLVGWSQAGLARQCGISVTAMNAIDRGHVKPRSQTLQKIEQVLENSGVEFLEGDGVRMRDVIFRVTTFEGHDAFQRYMGDILETLREKGGEGLHSLDDERPFVRQYHSVFLWYYQQFRKYGLKERILMREGITTYYGTPDVVQYRWCSHDLASQVSASVYGDKYSIMLPDRLVIIENKLMADTYRQQFENNWERSKPIPRIKTQFEADLAKLARTGKN